MPNAFGISAILVRDAHIFLRRVGTHPELGLGERTVRDITARLDVTSAGLVLEGFVEGLRIGLAAHLHPEIAYNVLQRAADEAARPFLTSESDR